LKIGDISVMSVVKVDKMASAVLIRNCSIDYFVQLIPGHFKCGDSDDLNSDKIARICDSIVSAGICILCIVHSAKNDGSRYYHCKKTAGDNFD
jgi:hypothetical protein